MAPVFANLNASLPPLIPKPEDQMPPPGMVFAPTQPDMAALAPVAPSPTSGPKVFHPLSPEEQIGQHLEGRLAQDYQKDLTPWGTPQSKHPGVFGKIAHALNVATGGENRRLWEEQGLQKNLLDLGKQQSEEGLQNAETQHYEQEARTGTPVEVTPEMAEQLGTPELAGQMMPSAAIAALSKQHGINTTKKETTEQTTASHERIAAGQNETKLTAAQIQAMNKVQPHITVQLNGQPHVMERDPGTGQYSIDRGVAPPNYAQVLPEMLATKTTEVLGDDNVMHRYQWNPQTRSYSDDIGAVPTGTAAHQIFQGAAIESLAPQVIQDINDNRQILGNLSSYYKQWLAGTPVSDPNAAKLMTELMSFAAMQPALHAFRSTNALDAFEKMVGGLSKNPDATIATINGLLKTPEAFTSVAHGAGRHTGSTPESGGGGGRKAMLNGQQIEVRNGKWVYSKTGKAAE